MNLKNKMPWKKVPLWGQAKKVKFLDTQQVYQSGALRVGELKCCRESCRWSLPTPEKAKIMNLSRQVACLKYNKELKQAKVFTTSSFEQSTPEVDSLYSSSVPECLKTPDASVVSPSKNEKNCNTTTKEESSDASL